MRRLLRLLGLLLLGAPVFSAAVDYPEVVPERPPALPRDGGAHPAFRTEWWYVTGWLVDDTGHERGFQVTFFRVRSGIGEDRPGRFSPAQLMFAHAAIADPEHGRLLHTERRARASGEVAGAGTERTAVWLGDWTLRAEGETYVAEVNDEAFGFRLRLATGQPPMLNGDAGFSRKGPGAGEASYYYSRPQLRVEGELRLPTGTRPVSGTAWLDQEWSSAYRPEAAVGWDWVGLNLDDGGAVMAFRMRDAAGKALWAGATLRDPTGATRALARDEVRFEPLRYWTSPRSGVRYPVEWAVRVDDRAYRLVPLMDDQELDSRRSTDVLYWEGAVHVFAGAERVGRGYLEMTGYGDRLRM